IAPHWNGWSSDFTGQLQRRAPNQDYYEFTWSGFTLTGMIGINLPVHNVALNSLIQAVQIVQQKGYSKVNIISHSWGTVLSRDAQYAGIGDIDTWVTMGSPLPKTTRTPGSLDKWINIWSPQDPVTRLGPALAATGVEGGSGYLFEKSLIRQVSITGGHSSYWTNAVALNTIGNQLTTQ
ncbi:hypothetical protein KAR91_38535, partial [Candidatus Pacearchaeota archaeon]|nr:hypothetical protein [Candidatus Pacearchaeota archaeon]